MPRPLLLGHRGARASVTVPENTCASFDLALEHGCDGFEFDLRLTACGRAVVCHDAEVNGITVSSANCDQLQDLPRLQDVLQTYAARAFLDLELKVAGLESRILTMLQESPPTRGYVVSSFLAEVLQELRIRSASVPLGIICDRQKDLGRWRGLPVEYVIPQYSLIGPDLVQQVHAAGRKLLAWTVNDRTAMLQLADLGVDGIISDQTELLVRTFG